MVTIDLVIILVSFGIYLVYQILAIQNVSKEFESQILKFIVVGIFPKKSYFTEKGWKYRITGVVIFLTGFALVLFLHFIA
jgi:hypothetical protein